MTNASIVVGTDGSGCALRAVELAAGEAAARGQSLRIVSVPFAWPASAPPGTYSFSVSPDVSAADRAAASSAVAVAADRVAELVPGLRVDTEVLPGSAPQVLLGCAADSSMLVVGSRRAGGFAAMMLGSVSRCVAVNSPCPAVVVKGTARSDRHSIVVGVREPDRAAAALRFGLEDAARHDSRLVGLHAWGSPGLLENAGPGVDPDEAAVIAGDRLRDILDGWTAEYPGVKISAEVVRDHPGRALAAASADADLVVLGRHHAPPSDAPAVCSALHAVLNNALGPVLC